MEKMTDKLREYLSKASKEDLEKDFEELKGFNEIGIDALEFIKDVMKKQKIR